MNDDTQEEAALRSLKEFSDSVNKLTEDIGVMFESFLRDESALEEFSKLLGEIPNNQGQQNGDETVT
jgi:hypothetical protein